MAQFSERERECEYEGERLARIEVKVDGINERLDKINGRVGEVESSISAIRAKCAVHDSLTVETSRADVKLDTWRDTVDSEISSLRESRVVVRTTSANIIQALGFVGIVLTLMLTMWQISSARHVPAAPSVQQQAK